MGAQDSTGPVVAGNVYDKWRTRNPLARLLMANFERNLLDLVAKLAPQTVLEVGCGEGEVASRLAVTHPLARIVALDVDHPVVEEAQRRHPGLAVLTASADRLPFPDDSFDLVVLSEVLEHLDDPDAALAEAARVSRSHCIFTVPHEPIWRGLNMLRGAYVRDFGNTPGHVQHWGRREFVRFVRGRLNVREVRAPFPWTAVVAEVR